VTEEVSTDASATNRGKRQMSRLYPEVGEEGLPNSGQTDGREGQGNVTPAHVGEIFQKVRVRSGDEKGRLAGISMVRKGFMGEPRRKWER